MTVGEIYRGELERLRREVELLRATRHDSIEHAAGVIDKYREALERIESCADDSFVMRDIAREALRGD